MSAQGSIISGGRFNYVGLFEVLYLSTDVHTCIEETTRGSQADGYHVAQLLPRTIIGIQVDLSRVLDLTDPSILAALGLSLEQINDPLWRFVQENEQREAFTQMIGRLARNAGFEALLVTSSLTPGQNLDVFPDRLLASSHVDVINEVQLPFDHAG